MTPKMIARLTTWAMMISVVCGLATACDVQIETSNGDESAQWTPQRLSEARGIPVDQIRNSIAELVSGKALESIPPDTWRHVRGLYRVNGGGPLWLARRGIDRRRAGDLGNAVAAAPNDGLAPDNLPIEATIEALEAAHRRQATATELARADVMLSALYAALTEHMTAGQVDPRSVSQSWYIDPREERIDSVLARTLRARRLQEAIMALRPQDPAYQALRAELERFREIAAKGGWPRVPEGASLSPGDTAPAERLAVLRERLTMEGLVVRTGRSRRAATGEHLVYDSTLAGAVARFQERHGIAVDSMLGEETTASLNIPVEYRVAQIAANIERFRWLPRSLGTRYILVNVPAFRLAAFDSGREVLGMKVIVGAEYDGRSTPVFSDSMQHVVFRPYWNVPEKIAENEIWPKADADPTYLDRNNYEVVEGEEGPRVRQRPGQGNALGLVKFLFPNSFAIYLHDTPQGELFEKDVRAFSHGCIRVERPVELAQFALGWPADSVRRMMESGKNDRHVEVPRKIPVYIVYFTAYMRDGQLHFGNDLYSRDDALVKALRGSAVPDERTLGRLEALRRLARR